MITPNNAGGEVPPNTSTTMQTYRTLLLDAPWQRRAYTSDEFSGTMTDCIAAMESLHRSMQNLHAKLAEEEAVNKRLQSSLDAPPTNRNMLENDDANDNEKKLIKKHIQKVLFRTIKFVRRNARHGVALKCMKGIGVEPLAGNQVTQREWAAIHVRYVTMVIGKERGQVNTKLKTLCHAYHKRAGNVLPTAEEMESLVLRNFDPTCPRMCKLFDWYSSQVIGKVIQKGLWAATSYGDYLLSEAHFTSTGNVKLYCVTVQDEAFLLLTYANAVRRWLLEFNGASSSSSSSASDSGTSSSTSSAEEVSESDGNAVQEDVDEDDEYNDDGTPQEAKKSKQGTVCDGIYTKVSAGRACSGWSVASVNVYNSYVAQLKQIRENKAYRTVEKGSMERLRQRKPTRATLAAKKRKFQQIDNRSEETIRVEQDLEDNACEMVVVDDVPIPAATGV